MPHSIALAALLLATPAHAPEPDIQARIVAALTGNGAVVTGHADRVTAPMQDRLVGAVTGAGLTYRPSADRPVDMQAAVAHAIGYSIFRKSGNRFSVRKCVKPKTYSSSPIQ